MKLELFKQRFTDDIINAQISAIKDSMTLIIMPFLFI